MLSAQRRRMILEEIELRGMGTITEFSQKFEVSGMTIRRDLQVLEEKGYIERTYGGAICRRASSLISDSYTAKQKIASDQKKRLAKYAAEHFIRENDIIVLEGGTTVVGMVPFLDKRKKLTVVTHSLYAANELQHFLADFTVICAGGILRDESFTSVGPVTERFFKEFHANKAFLSFAGLTAEDGFTDPSMLETQVKQSIVESVDQVIALVDSSKFGVRSLTNALRLNQVDDLVTDEAAPKPMLQALEASGVVVHIAR